MPHLRPLFAQFRGLPFVSISDAQRAPLDGLDINWVATVYHGLPLDEYPFSPDGGDELVYLARISPEKRPDLAIEVAKRAGIKLTMAAKIDPTEKDYFKRDIRPLLDHPLIDFVGEVDHRRKVELLTRARALLFPIDWPEPFGLVMIEAMACGTPVVTRPCGAVPDRGPRPHRTRGELRRRAGKRCEARGFARPPRLPPGSRGALQRGADGHRL